MTGVLFVCHGNICRSPMAEFLFKDLVARRGLAERFHIESAATTTDEIGNAPHAGTCAILAREGVSCEGKRARQITRDDDERFDVIIGMEDANMRSMQRAFGGDPAGKLHKMMEFAGSERDVADPWYTGDFEATFRDVSDGCEGLLSWLGY